MNNQLQPINPDRLSGKDQLIFIDTVAFGRTYAPELYYGETDVHLAPIKQHDHLAVENDQKATYTFNLEQFGVRDCEVNVRVTCCEDYIKHDALDHSVTVRKRQHRTDALEGVCDLCVKKLNEYDVPIGYVPQ